MSKVWSWPLPCGIRLQLNGLLSCKKYTCDIGNSSTFLGLTKGCIIYIYTQYTLYNYIIYIIYIHIHHMDNFKWLAPGSSQEQDSPLYRRMWYGVHSWRHTFRGFGWCCQPFTYWSQVSHIEVFEACTVAFDLAMFQFWEKKDYPLYDWSIFQI